MGEQAPSHAWCWWYLRHNDAGLVRGAGRAGSAPGGARPTGRGPGGGAGHRVRGVPVPGAGRAGPPSDRPPLLGEALEAARAIGDERSRSQALAALAAPPGRGPRLATERDQALREALEAARASEYQQYRSRALAALAPHLTEPLLREALEAARAIEFQVDRSQALAALAPRLADRAGPCPARGAGGGADDRGREDPIPGAGRAGPPPDPTERDQALARPWRRRGPSGTRRPGPGRWPRWPRAWRS